MKSAVKKEETTVTLKHDGKEVDATQFFAGSGFINAALKEAKGQIKNLLENHEGHILEAYRENDYDMKISLSISIKGSITQAIVGTDITYVVEKIKDGISEMVNTAQPKML